MLSPEQIARRLDDAFRLLTTGSRTALARHRTLRATMEWSFALLAAREQTLLRRLAVFAGSFTLDAAEAVCAGAPLETEDILDGVSALVDESLITMEPGDGMARYRLLETVRQYDVERLAEAGELAAMEGRFAEHFLTVIEEAEPALVGGSNAPALLPQLVADQDNLRAATHWALADASRAEMALRFVGALYWYWYAMGQFREARQLVNRALALGESSDPLYRGRALVSSALTALAQGGRRSAIPSGSRSRTTAIDWTRPCSRSSICASSSTTSPPRGARSNDRRRARRAGSSRRCPFPRRFPRRRAGGRLASRAPRSPAAHLPPRYRTFA